MLVLTRKVGEQIVIGDAICITVVAIRGDRVRLGITAPRETVVDRRETHERRTGPRDPLVPRAPDDDLER
jgi:carbon storage regulator